MPRWMRRFLSRNSLLQHFWLALGLGVFLRTLCAIFVYGPQALDDYKHGVWPAYQYFLGQPPDLPEYRSHLLVWTLALFLRFGSWVGVESAVAQVRAMYFGLGLISLLGIWGTYIYVKTFRSRLFAALALYLVAVFPLMPFVSTRAFGESVAMSFVLLGFGILESSRRRPQSRRLDDVLLWTGGFAALGVATLFRFHVGVLYLTYAAVLLLKKNWMAVGAALFAGLLTLAAQASIDWMSGKEFFGTLISYLAENEGGARQYGVSPWYNTWLFVLVVSLAPFSLVFARKIPALWRQHWPWLVPFLVFILAHSLVAHKEERFLYPIVGIELWALAWVWSAGALDWWARKVYAPVFFTLCGVLLLVVCFVNTQEGEIEPPAYAESHYHDVVYLDDQSLFGMSRFQFYFLRPPSVLKAVEKEDLNARQIDQALESDPHHRAVVLLTSVPEVRDQLRALEGVKTMESQCLTMRSAGSVIDRLLYALNAKHNQRRRPTWYLVCERG